MSTFQQLIAESGVNVVFQILVSVMASTFGICVLETSEITDTVLGQGASLPSHVDRVVRALRPVACLDVDNI